MCASRTAKLRGPTTKTVKGPVYSTTDFHNVCTTPSDSSNYASYVNNVKNPSVPGTVVNVCTNSGTNSIYNSTSSSTM